MNDVMEKAGFGQRLIAYIIDGVVLSVILFVISIVLTIAFFALSGFNMTGEFMILNFVVFYGLAIIIPVGYYTYFFGTSGQTIGKKLLSIKIVSTDGTPMTYSKGFIRVIGYFVSGLFMGIGHLWMLIDDNKQNWQDKIAGTYVVKV